MRGSEFDAVPRRFGGDGSEVTPRRTDELCTKVTKGLGAQAFFSPTTLRLLAWMDLYEYSSSRICSFAG